MTKKDFSLMLGNIGDKYIVEAYAYVESHKRKFIPKRWIALAACIILIVAAFPIGIMLENSGWFTPVGTGPITTAPTVVTDPPPSHVHEWGKWSLIRMATASEEGLEERVCECGEKETNAFPLGSEGLEYKLKENETNEIIITGIGTCTDIELVIGTYIDGYRVTELAEEVFKDRYDITSVEIPYSITSISKGAFSGCRRIKKVILPDGLIQISEKAFKDCSALISIKLPDGLRILGDRAFACCYELSNVTIPKSIEEIGLRAFYECFSLKNINLPSSIKKMGNGIFMRCTTLNSVTIENGITEIPTQMFYHCTSLNNVIIPESVKVINNEAFEGCTVLESITLHDGITSIGSYAFKSCPSLHSIYIPRYLKEIKLQTFHSCQSLKDITFNGTKAEWVAIPKSREWEPSFKGYTIHCTDGDIKKGE